MVYFQISFIFFKAGPYVVDTSCLGRWWVLHTFQKWGFRISSYKTLGRQNSNQKFFFGKNVVKTLLLLRMIGGISFA
jgi:hypothetical protein